MRLNVRRHVDTAPNFGYTVYMTTDTLTAQQATRYNAIEAELATFVPESDVQRFSDLCDEQARIYSDIAAADYDLAKTL